MMELRITKYDPQYRDSQGRYLRDEWTSVCDVGKTFLGKTLSVDEYRATEAEYVRAVMRFLDMTQTESLQITGLEDYPDNLQLLPKSMVDETRAWVNGIKDGVFLSENRIEECIRLNLRDVVWCRMSSDDTTTYVHFGYDYYMYVGSKSITVSLEAVDTPLFVEECPSPYWPDEERWGS